MSYLIPIGITLCVTLTVWGIIALMLKVERDVFTFKDDE